MPHGRSGDHRHKPAVTPVERAQRRSALHARKPDHAMGRTDLAGEDTGATMDARHQRAGRRPAPQG